MASWLDYQMAVTRADILGFAAAVWTVGVLCGVCYVGALWRSKGAK